MRTLRVLLAGAPDDARADPWALYDAAGRLVDRGRSPPEAWPGADRREAVLAADVVRVASITLPPLPAARVAQAARYALEDRLATPVEHAVVAVGTRAANGRVIAVVVARELADALVRFGRFDRVVAEPQLVDATDGWRWCESSTGAFVRTVDGAAFTVSPAADPSLPPELLLALAQAARAGQAPAQVIADRAADATLVAAWERASGVPFVAGTPWQWDAQPASRFAQAIDVLASVRAESAAQPKIRLFGLATALQVIAFVVAVHVVATAATWLWARIELHRAETAVNAIAREAGASDAAALARVHADARHRAGLHAPDDAMPLLALAAPALAALPPGALKTATFSAGAWTLELASLDDAALADFDSRLESVGLTALHAKSATGVRARVGYAP